MVHPYVLEGVDLNAVRGVTAALDGRTLTPREALEVLITEDLWPFALEGEDSPSWGCLACNSSRSDRACYHCGSIARGPQRGPGSVADVVTVRGVDRLRRVAALATTLCRGLEWRVSEASDLVGHHQWMEYGFCEYGPFPSWPLEFSLEEMEALRENSYAWNPDSPRAPIPPDAWRILCQFRAEGFHYMPNVLEPARVILGVARCSAL